MLKVLLTVATFLIIASTDHDGYRVGDNAADFRLKNVNGKMVSMADYPDAKGFIIIFTSSTCPYGKLYEERIIDLNEKYASQRYPVIAVNPNHLETSTGDSYEQMKIRAAEKSYRFPYLFDENRKVSAAFGVSRIPQVFVLGVYGGKYKVCYTGAIDDNFKSKDLAHEKYVENAVNQMMAGKEVTVKTTRPIGCSLSVL